MKISLVGTGSGAREGANQIELPGIEEPCVNSRRS